MLFRKLGQHPLFRQVPVLQNFNMVLVKSSRGLRQALLPYGSNEGPVAHVAWRSKAKPSLSNEDNEGAKHGIACICLLLLSIDCYMPFSANFRRCGAVRR